jgi:hypothetical protein
MFRRALNAKIDLSCIDHIIQGIEDDQPRFNKWCEKMAKRKQDDEDKLCCVCYECEADQPLKCSHKLCPTCYDKLTQCPLCREQFKEPVDDSRAEHERLQRLLADLNEWNARPIDVVIKNHTNDATTFDIVLRTVDIANQITQWLDSRDTIHYTYTPIQRKIMNISSFDIIVELIQLMANNNQRVELVIYHDCMFCVRVTNNADGSFEARCNKRQRTYNLINYIARSGNVWGSLSSHHQWDNRVTGIRNLTCLMIFLSLPIDQQLEERVHEDNDDDEW